MEEHQEPEAPDVHDMGSPKGEFSKQEEATSFGGDRSYWLVYPKKHHSTFKSVSLGQLLPYAPCSLLQVVLEWVLGV